MSNIIVVNQNYLCDPLLDPVLNNINSLDRRMLSYFCNMSADMNSSQIGLISRYGDNILPFNNNVMPMIDSVMPKYDPNFNHSWEQVTDQRALDLEKLVLQGKKVVVFWSGGIDSTCILVAILKNFSKSNLQQVRVACTWDSVAENPVFYNNHILPNLVTIDTNHYVNHELAQDTNTLIVEGFAADTISMSMTPSLDVCMAVRHGELLLQDWRKPDQLIQYLTRITGSKEFAQWYYDRNCASIESIDVPIETYFDFMWWFGFNCEYYSWALHAWFLCYRHLNIPYSEFKSRCIGWYRTDSYQLWAMKNNGAMVKHGIDLGSFKRYPKQYIYNYDHNEYYWRYKTKINSRGREYNSRDDKPFAITDQFQILYLEKDIDQILEQLPSHIKP